MIGVDITTISRFEDKVDALNWFWDTKYEQHIDCAKHWALAEAIYKAGGRYRAKELRFVFEIGEPPTCNVPYDISISHEGEMLIAVALRRK